MSDDPRILMGKAASVKQLKITALRVRMPACRAGPIRRRDPLVAGQVEAAHHSAITLKESSQGFPVVLTLVIVKGPDDTFRGLTYWHHLARAI